MRRPAVRPMQAADIAFAERLMQREGWDIACGSIAMHLAHDPEGCFICQWDGRPVGMITSTCYGERAFMGNLIVEPACRRMGVGEALMRRAMEHARDAGCRTFLLEADQPGVRLYRRLGFVDLYESLRFETFSLAPVAEPFADAIRPIEHGDPELIAELDASAVGDDRSRLLAALLDRAPAAFLAERDDTPVGYIIAQSLHDGVRIGPFIAVDENAGGALLDAVLKPNLDCRYAVGLPAVNEAGAALFRERGFKPRASSLRMVWHRRTYDDQPGRVFGIAGGDRGLMVIS